MGVESRTHPDIGGEGTQTGKLGIAEVNSTAGGVAVNFASDFQKSDGAGGAEAIDLSSSLLKRLTLINNHATADVLVQFDGIGTSLRLAAGGTIERANWDTTIEIKLIDDAVASVPVYLEAAWDTEV